MERKAFSKNETVKLAVTDITQEGDGIGRIDGYTVFVRGAVPGDTVLARILRPKKTYAFAKAEEILVPSKDRTEPPCPIAGKCGGCSYQSLTYEAQLSIKENLVRQNLSRIGGFSGLGIEPIIAAESPLRYRDKALLPVREIGGRLRCGYYAPKSHRIVPVGDCLLSPSFNEKIIDTILGFCEENGIPAYDEETGTGLLRHIFIREGAKSGEIMAGIVCTRPSVRNESELARRLAALAPDEAHPAHTKGARVVSVIVNHNPDRTNVILGRATRVIYGKEAIEDELLGLKFRLSPHAFYQVNPAQTERLYETALEFAALKGGETVYDLFCGIGTISLALAQKAGEVYGVEIVEQAVADARENAKLNGLSNARFFAAPAEEIASRGFFDEDTPLKKPDAVVLDPPRKGCEASLLSVIRNLSPERIVYVSCDSATLARDLKELCRTDAPGSSYRIERVRPVDMFPETGHVETVVLLSR